MTHRILSIWFVEGISNVLYIHYITDISAEQIIFWKMNYDSVNTDIDISRHQWTFLCIDSIHFSLTNRGSFCISPSCNEREKTHLFDDVFKDPIQSFPLFSPLSWLEPLMRPVLLPWRWPSPLHFSTRNHLGHVSLNKKYHYVECVCQDNIFQEPWEKQRLNLF